MTEELYKDLESKRKERAGRISELIHNREIIEKEICKLELECAALDAGLEKLAPNCVFTEPPPMHGDMARINGMGVGRTYASKY
jgi:hypothetical protein